eukprot:566908-Rhodomonas_salina.1
MKGIVRSPETPGPEAPNPDPFTLKLMCGTQSLKSCSTARQRCAVCGLRKGTLDPNPCTLSSLRHPNTHHSTFPNSTGETRGRRPWKVGNDARWHGPQPSTLNPQTRP